MVQCHLVRLCEASYRCLNDSGQDHATHWAGQYNLRQAWPPSTSRKDSYFSDYSATMNEINRNYADYDYEDNDIGTIMDMLEDKIDFDLVLRQTVSNAQGADLMILSRKEGNVVLHLFQCKNVKSIPGVYSIRFAEWFQSLGVQVDKGDNNVNVEPDCGSAGYSFLGTQHLAQKLGEKLGTQVTIGHRILVFSAERNQQLLDRDFLQKAMENGVMVWTREMLEPTISALYTNGKTEGKKKN
jgi:hypothetical protein